METKKLWKTTMMALFACTFVFASACSNNSAAPSGAASGAKKEEENNAVAKGKYDNPITLTTVGRITPSTTFKNGETMEDNVHTRWAKDRLGINLKYLWTASTQNKAFETRLRLALSANEPMPDVIAVDNIQLANDLIDSGQFLDAKSMWDKYASPTYKKAVNEDPTMWYPFTRKDGVYAIPIPDYAWNNDTVLWIRQDWLDKLGLKGPETLDDLEKIMDAFVNQDPDGNGKKDTYGITMALKDSFKSTQSTASFVFGAYGTIPEQWNDAADGTLSYGSINPGSKQALQRLSDWVKKGFVPKEAGLFDESKAAELFTSGRAGMIAGPYWMDRTPLINVKKNVPTANFKAYPVPKGPDGKAGRIGTQNFSGAVLINKNAKNPEAFFVYQNYLFENFALMQSDEFKYQFAEGYDYALKDGKVSYDSKDIPGGRVIPQKYTIAFEGARIPSSAMESLGNLAKGGEPRNNFERKDSLFSDALRYQGVSVNIDSKSYSMRDKFIGIPTKTMKTRWENLSTSEAQTFTKIVYGDLPIDEFDNFVKKWKSSGGDDITKEVNEWYSSVKK
ncbi:extracellular solute-binding protein [Paenibacillus piri]|uniref:Sugar ABC transporter n=1 Tax=Paenibacillus piri TaxID=2547395 RepID=A0A4R5KR58_9BACL|nr:extracellular solute-binding protein [Paenibacillus piri]TDF98076.1 sugar ABC transporter [Paenibacillus piri]